MASVYSFVHSENLHLSKNSFIGHNLSAKENIVYNPIDQSEKRTKNLEVLQDAIFLVSKDVLQNTHHSMRWLSSFGKVYDPLKMVALALDEAQVKISTHKQFVGEASRDCKLDPVKSFLIRVSSEECYKNFF